MSGFIGKTLDSIGTLFSPLGTDVGLKNMIQRCFSARTKREEQLLVRDGLRLVKIKLSEPSIKCSVVSRCLAFCVFAELSGHRAEFAHIHAVKQAQNGSLTEKKIGYLACAFFLTSTDPLCVLLVNTIARDLMSKNMFVVAMALSATCHLIPCDQTTGVLGILEEKLKHTNEFIRSKAVIALHHLLRTSPQLCYHFMRPVKLLLGDKDPAVVAQVLQLLLHVAENDTDLVGDIVSAVIQIQNQILDGKLPLDYMYRGLPAPWMQISIMRLLRFAPESSPEINLVLQRTLESAKSSAQTPIGGAVICECITTLVHHKVGDELLASSLLCVGELMSSNNSDLSYSGLCLLEMILHNYKLSLSSSQQQVVLAGLCHPDETMKQRTLSLLCAVAEAHSAQSVCEQVVTYVQTKCTGNQYLQQQMIERVVALTDKFPDYETQWHLAVLIQLLPLALPAQARAIQRRIQLALLQENAASARSKVLQIFGKCSQSKTVSLTLMEVYAWALSEFSTSAVQELVSLGRKVLHSKEPTHSICSLLAAIIHALRSCVQKSGIDDSSVEELLMNILELRSGDAHLHQVCIETLATLPHLREVCLVLQREDPANSLDFTLSFLDKYVCDSLTEGDLPYRPMSETPILEVPTTGLCPSPVSSGFSFPMSGSFSSEDSSSWSLRSPRKEVIAVKSVWSREGRAEASESDMEQLASLVFTGAESNQRTDALSDLLLRDFQKLSDKS